MIENIKRFVNEHRTLMVIIITVLVICFLYCWFCCKDRPLTDRVKGGKSGLDFTIKDDFYYMMIGMNCVPSENDKYLICLSRFGEEEIPKCIPTVDDFDFYLSQFLKKYPIKDLVKNPNGYLFPGRPQLYIDLNAPDVYKSGTNFDICTILRNYEKGEEILGLYKEFIDEIITPMNKYFYKVRRVAQLAKDPLNEYVPELNFFNKPNQYISKNLSGLFIYDRFTNSGQICKSMNEEIRSWYISSSIGKMYIKKCYETCPNGIICCVGEENEDEENEGEEDENEKIKGKKTKGRKTKDKKTKDKKTKLEKTVEKEDDTAQVKKDYEVADIYPAYKLIMALVLIIARVPDFVGEKPIKKYSMDEYMRLLASFVLYVNLFNTYCAVKMEKKWNDKIKNEYVYIFNEGEEGNENALKMNMENLELLEGKSHAVRECQRVNESLGNEIEKIKYYGKKVVKYRKILEEKKYSISEKSVDELLKLSYEDPKTNELILGYESNADHKVITLKGEDKADLRKYYRYLSSFCGNLAARNAHLYQKNFSEPDSPLSEDYSGEEKESSGGEREAESDGSDTSENEDEPEPLFDFEQKTFEEKNNPPISVEANQILHELLEQDEEEGRRAILKERVRGIPKLIQLLKTISRQDDKTISGLKTKMESILKFLPSFLVENCDIISMIEDLDSLIILLKEIDGLKKPGSVKVPLNLNSFDKAKMSVICELPLPENLFQETDFMKIKSLSCDICGDEIEIEETPFDELIEGIVRQIIKKTDFRTGLKDSMCIRTILNYLETFIIEEKQYEIIAVYLFKTFERPEKIETLEPLELVLLLQVLLSSSSTNYSLINSVIGNIIENCVFEPKGDTVKERIFLYSSITNLLLFTKNDIKISKGDKNVDIKNEINSGFKALNEILFTFVGEKVMPEILPLLVFKLLAMMGTEDFMFDQPASFKQKRFDELHKLIENLLVLCQEESCEKYSLFPDLCLAGSPYLIEYFSPKHLGELCPLTIKILLNHIVRESTSWTNSVSPYFDILASKLSLNYFNGLTTTRKSVGANSFIDASFGEETDQFRKLCEECVGGKKMQGFKTFGLQILGKIEEEDCEKTFPDFLGSLNERVEAHWIPYVEANEPPLNEFMSVVSARKALFGSLKAKLIRLWLRLELLGLAQNFDETLNKISKIKDCDKRKLAIEKERKRFELVLEELKDEMCESGEPKLIDQIEMINSALRKLKGEENKDDDEIDEEFWDKFFEKMDKKDV